MAAGRKKRDGRLLTIDEKGGPKLLPGLPNDIVLAHIVPKLPWRAFFSLSSVSPYWLDAIRTRKVYNARAGSNSTETLVVLNHNHPSKLWIHAISLYSMRDNSWHLLPHFPFSMRGIPSSCQCVSLDGKLYVLGGDPYHGDSGDSRDSDVTGQTENSCDSDTSRDDSWDSDDDSPHRVGNEVYVLDLAEQTGWKQCAPMPEPRTDFGCGVMDGKIYVFGGIWGPEDDRNCFSESFVYDPTENAWSSRKPMTSKRSDHHVVAVGDELFVHGGYFGGKAMSRAMFSEVYNPREDKWTYVEPFIFESAPTGKLFTAEGKLYLMTFHCIYGLAESSSMDYSWTLLHSFGSPDLEPEDGQEYEVVAAQAIDGEVLAVISSDDTVDVQTGLCRSTGFGGGREEIEFELVECGILGGPLGGPEHHWFPHLMCPIQL